MRDVRFCVSTRRCSRALSMDAETRAASNRSSDKSPSLESVQASGLNIDDADQLAASEHRNGKLRSNSVERRKITRIVLNIVDHDGVTRSGRGPGNAFSQWNDKTANDFVPCPRAYRIFKPCCFSL